MISSFFLYDEFAPGNLRYKEIANWVSSYDMAALPNFIFVKRNKRVLAVPKPENIISGWIVKPYSELASMIIRTTIDQAVDLGLTCTRVTVYCKDTQVYLYTWKFLTVPGEHIVGSTNFLHFQDQA